MAVISSDEQYSLPRMIPSGSMINGEGIPLTPYLANASLFHPCKSDTCGHVKESSVIAFIQFSWEISPDTPKITKPWSWYFEYNSTRAGFAARQGAHHDAQKSIKM